LGEGVNNWVNALAVSGSDVYVGGNFTTAGGSPANYVARWDGNHWHALGLGLDGMVDALAVSGNDLYVGGWFSMAGGSPAKRIAKWDGNQWSPLGAGRVGVVKALAVLGSDLYVGDTSGIAKWDGSRWSALGSGVGGSVYALAVSGSELYAGGSLVGKVGGTLVNNIAKWDGSHWSALGSGVNNWVAALTVSGSQLYVGGTFTMAGGKVSASMARAYLESPVLSQDRSDPGVTLSWPTFYESFVLQQNADTANPDTWSNADFPVTIEGHTKRVTVPHMSDRQFFRLKGD